MPDEAGRIFQRQTRVVANAREDDLIQSSVKGSQTKPYRQTIKILKEKDPRAQSLFDPDGEPTLAMTEADIELLLAS